MISLRFLNKMEWLSRFALSLFLAGLGSQTAFAKDKECGPILNGPQRVQTLTAKEQSLYGDPLTLWTKLNHRILQRSKTHPSDKWNFSVADLFSGEAQHMILNLEHAVKRFKFLRLNKAQNYAQLILDDLKRITNPTLPRDEQLPYWRLIQDGRRHVAVMTLYTSGWHRLLLNRRWIEERAENLAQGFKSETDTQTRSKSNWSTSLGSSMDIVKEYSSSAIHIFWVPLVDPVGKRIFIRSRSIPLVALDLSGRRQAPDNLNNDAPDYYSWHDETHAFSNYNFLVMAEQSETELAENTKFNIFLDEWVQKHSDINVRTAGTEILYERAHELFLSPVAYKESLLAPDMDKILSESRAFADKITPLDRQTWWNQSTFQAAVFLIQAGVDAYIKQYGPPPCWRTDKPSRIFGR